MSKVCQPFILKIVWACFCSLIFLLFWKIYSMKMLNVYALVDPRTGRKKYVGQTKHKPEYRLRAHIGRSKNGIDKTPKADWIRELLLLGLEPNLQILTIRPTQESADYFETIAINPIPNLLNSQSGGKTGYKHSAETIINWKNKVVHTERHRQHLQRLNNSPENLKRLKENNEARKIPVLHIDKLTGETIKLYKSANEAARALNLQASNIGKVCKGERTSTCGYVFKYKN